MLTAEPAPSAGGGLVRLRLDLAYDGTDFHGWARQPGLRTVEGVVTDALTTALRPPNAPELVVAGRTDSGVHARGQVVHVDAPAATASDTDTLRRRLSGLLPPDVSVAHLRLAPPGFDARFSALWRSYEYTLCDSGAPDPLRRREVVVHRHRIDVDAMNAASELLLGEHDFVAYCRPRPGASTIRELQVLRCGRFGGAVVVQVRADAFCHHMVRALVGALVSVGDGRRTPGWPRQVLDAGMRDGAVTVMPAPGLVLVEVGYPDADGLAARAALTRRARTRGPAGA